METLDLIPCLVGFRFSIDIFRFEIYYPDEDDDSQKQYNKNIDKDVDVTHLGTQSIFFIND